MAAAQGYDDTSQIHEKARIILTMWFLLLVIALLAAVRERMIAEEVRFRTLT
jgi:hypothetical protein